MSNVLQIQPNHADHISMYKDKYLEDMLENEFVVGQPKYDGERMLIHFDGQNVYCTSRRISKKTNEFMRNDDKLPKLIEGWKNVYQGGLGYTVIDCECYAKNWSEAASVLHSLPEKASELQKSITIKYACFDCLYFNGEDLRDKPYTERLAALIVFLNKYPIDNMHIVQFINQMNEICDYQYSHFLRTIRDCRVSMQNAINSGFEGIVIKSLNRKYYDKGASIKCKKFETVDLVVYGYQQGNGKYSNTVGALYVGYYDPDKDDIVHVAHVNCSTDEERNMWRDKWLELKYSVIEVKCQEITGKSLRHPVYVRLRQDKNAKECTKDTIFKEDI